jgi:hypothetical protein
MSTGSQRALPDDAVLMHIGPHKTGTTAIQTALFEARNKLARQGVIWPARSRHPRPAFLAAIGTTGLRGERYDPDPQAWAEMCARSDDPRRRSVISSEIFANASDAAIQSVVSDLGTTRVHVVVTLRPLARILASQWQQLLHSRVETPYLEWLEEVLRSPDGKQSRRFWRRHAHDQLVQRWVDATSPDRVVAVVSDPAKPAALMHAFENLLDLKPRTLRVPQQANRSLTCGEAEVLRLVNIEASRIGWSDKYYAANVRLSLCERFNNRPVGTDDVPIRTPGWALDLANRRQASIIEGIRASGVQVIGNLDDLAVPVLADSEEPQDALLAATRLITGMALRDAPVSGLESASTRTLLRISAARMSRSLKFIK